MASYYVDGDITPAQEAGVIAAGAMLASILRLRANLNVLGLLQLHITVPGITTKPMQSQQLFPKIVTTLTPHCLNPW